MGTGCNPARGDRPFVAAQAEAIRPRWPSTPGCVCRAVTATGGHTLAQHAFCLARRAPHHRDRGWSGLRRRSALALLNPSLQICDLVVKLGRVFTHRLEHCLRRLLLFDLSSQCLDVGGSLGRWGGRRSSPCGGRAAEAEDWTRSAAAVALRGHRRGRGRGRERSQAWSRCRPVWRRGVPAEAEHGLRRRAISAGERRERR